MNYRRTLVIIALLAVTAGAVAQEQPAPSAQIPPRGEQTQPAPIPQPQQTIRRTIPTLAEEIEAAVAEFRPAYQKAGSPRILILFNRDMEDNDDENMVKTRKVRGGVSSVSEGEGSNPKTSAGINTGDLELNSSSEGTRTRTRTEGGSSTYERVAPGPETYTRQEIEMIREAFEQPFLRVPVKLVDRDTAVRLHGLTEEAVFAYTDLPEAQRAQVEGVKEFADILITVRVERGQATVRKVSGDYNVEVPNIVARAIKIDGAQVIASSTTGDVSIGGGDFRDVAARVSLALLSRIRS